MDPRATADLLKSWAREAGFDRAGVATLEPLEHGEALVRWLERGDQAGMEYLAKRLAARVRPWAPLVLLFLVLGVPGVSRVLFGIGDAVFSLIGGDASLANAGYNALLFWQR